MPELDEKESFWRHFIGNVKAKKKAAYKAPRAKTATVKPKPVAPKPEAPKPETSKPETIHVPETPQQKQARIFAQWDKEPILKKHIFKNQ